MIATTTVGSPFIRSRAILTARAERRPANSARKIATRTPKGMAIAVATATITAVPTIAGAIPPIAGST